MKLVLTGNPLFQSSSSKIPSKPSSPMGTQPDSSNQLSRGITPSTGDSGIGGVPAIQLKNEPNVVLSLTHVALTCYQVWKHDHFGSSFIKCDQNFTKESVLRHGGFGVRVVYKGQLDDGTKIAVKRMESGVICNKALDEFESEISVLTKVRHIHLVSLLGYSTQGLERILVYKYMHQGELSRHLFHWKNFKLEPLSWKRMLNIALDVAKGMEYLHLAHQSFIHPDGDKRAKYENSDIRISDISDSDIGYFIADFRIRIHLNTSNFHTTSLPIAVTPVTPSASIADYHRHTFTLILTITLIYTFQISLIFITTDPNVLNQLQRGLDLGNNNFSPPQLKYNPSMKLVLSGNPLFQSSSSKIPPKPSSPTGSQPDSSSQHTPRITPRTKCSSVPHSCCGFCWFSAFNRPFSELGHRGFGVVYKGQLDDGTKIAVKRMESGVICNKALDEFESEISVLTKVRHLHLVSLLGYST
ncbi:putative protein kinase RLK-Pelle-LRR-IX family [Helianthus anomalus]